MDGASPRCRRTSGAGRRRVEAAAGDDRRGLARLLGGVPDGQSRGGGERVHRRGGGIGVRRRVRAVRAPGAGRRRRDGIRERGRGFETVPTRRAEASRSRGAAGRRTSRAPRHRRRRHRRDVVVVVAFHRRRRGPIPPVHPRTARPPGRRPQRRCTTSTRRRMASPSCSTARAFGCCSRTTVRTNALPLTLEAPVVELERHTQDEDTRRRAAHLRHLPLTTQYAIAELDMTNLVPAETLREHGEELRRREACRRKRADGERKAEAAAVAAEARERRNARVFGRGQARRDARHSGIGGGRGRARRWC